MKFLLFLLLPFMAQAQVDTIPTPQVQTQINALGAQRNYFYELTQSLQSANKALIVSNQALIVANKALTDSLHPVLAIKGFNIHTFNSPIYSNIDNTITKVLAAGGNAVRVNVNVNSAGIATNEPKLLELMSKCKAAGITVMPMLNIDNGDINGTTASAVSTANGFAKYDFDYLEFGNELSIKDWVGDGSVRALKNGDGDLPSNYDLVLLAKIGKTVKAMTDAYRLKKPKVKIILDSEWLHSYYMDYLLNTLDVKIDILAWHWYSGQQLARVGKVQIRDFVKNKFPGYPLLWNEIGVDTDPTTGLITQQHYDAFSDMEGAFKKDGVVYYELFDEVERLPSKKEAGYGFYDKNGNPKPVLQLIK